MLENCIAVFFCGSKRTLDNVSEYNGIIIKNTKEKKLLGVIIDNNRNFNSHIKRMCKVEAQKSYALSRISRLLQVDQKALILNSFIKVQFNYCPLAWMFGSQKIQ